MSLCFDCVGCSKCSTCSRCEHCVRCEISDDCEYCMDCKFCIECKNCTGCKYCYNLDGNTSTTGLIRYNDLWYRVTKEGYNIIILNIYENETIILNDDIQIINQP